MATTLTATYSQSAALALYIVGLPTAPAGKAFTTITFETGSTISDHTSGVFRREIATEAGRMLEFELTDSVSGKTWVQAIFPKNTLNWKINAA